MTPQFARSVQRRGFRPTTAEIVKMRIVGIAHLRYGRLDRQDAVAAIHGVTPRFIEQLAQLGYRGVPAAELVQMRIMGRRR